MWCLNVFSTIPTLPSHIWINRTLIAPFSYYTAITRIFAIKLMSWLTLFFFHQIIFKIRIIIQRLGVIYFTSLRNILICYIIFNEKLFCENMFAINMFAIFCLRDIHRYHILYCNIYSVHGLNDSKYKVCVCVSSLCRVVFAFFKYIHDFLAFNYLTLIIYEYSLFTRLRF